MLHCCKYNFVITKCPRKFNWTAIESEMLYGGDGPAVKSQQVPRISVAENRILRSISRYTRKYMKGKSA